MVGVLGFDLFEECYYSYEIIYKNHPNVFMDYWQQTLRLQTKCSIFQKKKLQIDQFYRIQAHNEVCIGPWC